MRFISLLVYLFSEGINLYFVINYNILLKTIFFYLYSILLIYSLLRVYNFLFLYYLFIVPNKLNNYYVLLNCYKKKKIIIRFYTFKLLVFFL